VSQGTGPRPIVLSAPSGAGKTTIARKLVDGWDDFAFSVSATTRRRRPGERHGRDYLFVDEDEFRRMRDDGELLEWAKVHGSLYGTPVRQVTEAGARGSRVVLDIDVQGARQIRERLPEALTIFVLPPSGRVLADRLSSRGTETRAELERRLTNARDELLEARNFDHVIVNDDLNEAVEEVRRLATGEATAGREEGLEAILKPLIDEIDAIVRNGRSDER
jgi:guanylate kinase